MNSWIRPKTFTVTRTGLVVGRIVRSYREISTNVGKPVRRIKRGPNFHKKILWWLFYGACQDRKGNCGCGLILNLSNNHDFHLHLGARTSTNTQAEMLSLWGLLAF